uniref:p5 n=1 Tax=Simian T-lymphotropic virus 3 TaxID=39101 RepID=A0A0A7RQ37_9DELA|nr:p5 [Simian T-lymphotropic virus 3]
MGVRGSSAVSTGGPMFRDREVKLPPEVEIQEYTTGTVPGIEVSGARTGICLK